MLAPVTHRYVQLDGVRGIAILLVLILHYVASRLDGQANAITNIIARALGMTWSGVDLFFVLSGFLIGGILLDNREAPHYFKTFYIRRICRIFPLYFGWLLLFILITTFLGDLASSDRLGVLFQQRMPLWAYATFSQNFAMVFAGNFGPEWLGITWSLAIEEQFYLVLPLLIRFVSRRKLPYVLVTVIVAAPVLRSLSILPPPHSTFPSYVLMPLRADSLLLGVLCAFLLREKSASQYLRDHVRTLYFVFGILLGGVALSTIITASLLEELEFFVGYTWLALLYSCFILIAMNEKQSFVSRLTRTTWLCKLGILAHGVYLFHQAINGLAHVLLLNQTPKLQTIDDVIVTIIALLVTILIATLSWNVFEKRIVGLGHSVNYE